MREAWLEVTAHSTGVEVAVDDWEVFDFLEDLFIEFGPESTSMRQYVQDGRRRYALTFDPNISLEQVKATLDRISPGELDRIWRLNN